MTKAAAQAIAECITPEYLQSDYIISSVFDTDIIKKVAKEVVKTVKIRAQPVIAVGKNLIKILLVFSELAYMLSCHRI